MNWNALGAIGEMIGAVAVVITLIYLAIQMRQNSQQIAENTKVTRVATRGATQEAFSRYRLPMANSPGLAELYLKGCADYRARCHRECDRQRLVSVDVR